MPVIGCFSPHFRKIARKLSRKFVFKLFATVINNCFPHPAQKPIIIYYLRKKPFFILPGRAQRNINYFLPEAPAALSVRVGRRAEREGKMRPENQLEQNLTGPEKKILARLNTPGKIQAFLDELDYSTEEAYRCPLRVLRERVAHCYDGALFAAATLRRLGHPPLILEMLPNHRDDDHLLAPFKQDGHWGAVGKSNFVGLRFREPVYRTLRELIMSYFEQFYNVEREKTLRGYTLPMNLRTFDRTGWMVKDEPLDWIAEKLDRMRRVRVLNPKMVKRLSPLDTRAYEAGLLGADQRGLYRPSPKDGILISRRERGVQEQSAR
jgi:hypothetical protein